MLFLAVVKQIYCEGIVSIFANYLKEFFLKIFIIADLVTLNKIFYNNINL